MIVKNKRALLIGSVAAVHLFFFFFNFKSETALPPPKQSLIVHTYTPPPPKPIADPKPQPKRKDPVKGKLPSKKNSLLKELKESLKKIEATPPPPPSSLPLPPKIGSLQIDHADKKEENDYFVTLAHALKKGLELPEEGEVRLELTVSQSGQVLKLRVLHALSATNRRYLELNLPQMRLPPFSEELKNENSHTFTLTFCNAL